jgi:hypothetical protein
MSEVKKKDALLIAAKVGTILVRIGLVIGIVGISGAAAATLFNGGIPPEGLKVVVEGTELTEINAAVIGVLLVALASLALAYDFVQRLARIIDTVGEGDPFTAENAARLTRMGWTALAIQLIALPAMLVSNWLKPQMAEGTFSVTSDFSLTGIGLALVLFILARVFRKGAEMREDLEGTV